MLDEPLPATSGHRARLLERVPPEQMLQAVLNCGIKEKDYLKDL